MLHPWELIRCFYYDSIIVNRAAKNILTWEKMKVNGKELPFVTNGGGAFIMAGPRVEEEKPMAPRGNIVLSKHLADALFPDEAPVGKSITLHADWDIRGIYTITGIAEELGKCVLPDTAVYISFYESPWNRDDYMFKPASKKDVKNILELIRNHKTDDEYQQQSFQNSSYPRRNLCRGIPHLRNAPSRKGPYRAFHSYRISLPYFSQSTSRAEYRLMHP